MALDVIAEAKAKIEQRLKELSGEREVAHRALLGLETATNKRSPAPPIPGPSKKRGKKRARRGQRREQFIETVREKPGITVAEIAKKIGIAPSPLYALARQLVKDGEIKKDGTGYGPANQPSAKKATKKVPKPRKALKPRKARRAKS